MPKRKRREQQHLRQESTRRKSYTLGGAASGEKFKPPFPMNLMQNQKAFWLVGAVIMIGGLFAAVFLRSQNPSRTSPDVPSATASPTVDPNATPTPTATPDPKKFTEAAQVTDPSKSYQATIKTDKGDIVLKLYVDKAPLTVNAFVFLAQKGFYDGIVFHRVEPGFVVQGGDPTGTGSGGPGFETDIDQNDLKNKRGFVAMARAGASTKFGSQFFIDLKDNVALDSPSASVPKPYYPFAEVVSGMDVVDKLVKGDVMRSVTIQETAVAPAQ